MSGRRLKGGVSEGLGVSLHSLGACSACAGDYEDPDRTAWPLDVENAEAEVEIEIEIEEEVNPEVEEGDAGTRTHGAARQAGGGARESGGANDEFPAKEA